MKKILVLLLILTLTAAALISCGKKDKDNEGGGTENPPSTENGGGNNTPPSPVTDSTVWSKSTDTYIISDEESEEILSFRYHIFSLTEKVPTILTPSS